MEVSFDIFNEEKHIGLIEKWEKQGELYSYLSNTRPGFLRENGDRAGENTKLYVIRVENIFIGAAWLEDITINDAKLSVYIADKGFREKGIGKETVRYLLDVAFNEIKVERVYLNVRKNNERAINCYKKCGFTITKEYEKKFIGSETSLKVYEMAACRSEKEDGGNDREEGNCI